MIDVKAIAGSFRRKRSLAQGASLTLLSQQPPDVRKRKRPLRVKFSSAIARLRTLSGESVVFFVFVGLPVTMISFAYLFGVFAGPVAAMFAMFFGVLALPAAGGLPPLFKMVAAVFFVHFTDAFIVLQVIFSAVALHVLGLAFFLFGCKGFTIWLRHGDLRNRLPVMDRAAASNGGSALSQDITRNEAFSWCFR